MIFYLTKAKTSVLDLTSGVLSGPLRLDWGKRNRANNQKKDEKFAVRMVMNIDFDFSPLKATVSKY